MQRLTWRVDDEQVVADLQLPAGERAAQPTGVVWVHGFNSCRKELGDAPAALASHGHASLALDLRGHGESDGEPGLLTLGRVLSDITTAADRLREAIGDDARLGIMGHSMGGAWAIAALGRLDRFAAGVAVAPVHRPLDSLHPLERPLYNALGHVNARRAARGHRNFTIPYKNGYPSLFEDADAVARGRAIGFLSGRANLGCFDTLRTMDVAAWAADVAAPTLVIASRRDRVVPCAQSEAVHHALAGPRDLRWHDGGHSAFMDRDATTVNGYIAHWFTRHLGRAQ